ncbi:MULTISPECIES: GNAT family N-acetyltransferase [Yersinia]|uniref:GNAT family N-acetyltransferase n=1 Tax=Yersinia TaxID=629 RepID=UPI0005E15E70|nr:MULTISPECIES: GNAT family N-acetyltransferase [Yersinia]OVZ95027.1 N-acetyltransferase [Yersinia frederiksenii]RXA94588.1 GNAT family N-acetyltransferase [Yersinia sp. 2105 StPb PI]CNI39457.1 acetyltransferase [Yersinia frederiksenii]CNJ14730.1 acetyltransferase [Yersinia frederiksenii]CNK20140.1 acetyltransferase [Yersinia frederiksenii]
MEIRMATPADFAQIWPLFQAVISRGDTYVFTPDTSEQDAYDYWFGPGVRCFVALHEQHIVGMYKLIDNQRGLGSHVANASFMVDGQARGLGIGKALGIHCIEQATTLGYRAMQFNFVVSTNTLAVALWQKLGFDIIATLPNAFNHRELGYVDAYVMHRVLVPNSH